MAEVGRPHTITPEILTKLDEAFSNGASDKEAIFIAGVASSTFYKYCQENPEYLERKEALKDMIKYQARKNLTKAINSEDKAISQWYLERKVKEEFSPRQELEHSGEGLKVNVIYGKGDTTGLLSQSTSAVAREDTGGLEPSAVQDNGGGTQSA